MDDDADDVIDFSFSLLTRLLLAAKKNVKQVIKVLLKVYAL
jgi:hypothetical protein